MATERDNREPSGTIGFGFTPAPRAGYHFVVTIPRDESGQVQVAEHFVYGEDVEVAAARVRFEQEPPPYPIRHPQVKVELSLHKFEGVAEEVRAEFNRRLRQEGKKASGWKPGENILAPHLGKELVLLLWSIEEADPSLIPTALANWQGLVPEERWWLYTTINAATGHAAEGRGRGWRRAIRIAFTENPATQRPYFSQNGVTPLPSGQAASNKNEPTGGKRRRKRPHADQEPHLPFLAMDDDPGEGGSGC